MSFTASADKERMWLERDGKYITTAYCVFENEFENVGFIYLYINHAVWDQFVVIPYGSGDIGTVCSRKPK